MKQRYCYATLFPAFQHIYEEESLLEVLGEFKCSDYHEFEQFKILGKFGDKVYVILDDVVISVRLILSEPFMVVIEIDQEGLCYVNAFPQIAHDLASRLSLWAFEWLEGYEFIRNPK